MNHTPPPYHVGKHSGTIVSDSAEGITINGGTGAENVEYYGGNLIAESMSPGNAEFFSRAGNAFDPLVAALTIAKDTIRALHGIEFKGEAEERLWALYQGSPEMKEINAALAIANGEQVQSVKRTSTDNQMVSGSTV